MIAKKPAPATDGKMPSNDASQDEVRVLKDQLEQCQDRERRVLADYQNLIRRHQEDRGRFLKMAGREVVEALLQPLDHLSMAAAQLNDAGLSLVINQLWQSLKQVGLEEINPLGQPFDINTMEVIETQGVGMIVTKVVKRGYRLNDEVIQHAKVVVGDAMSN